MNDRQALKALRLGIDFSAGPRKWNPRLVRCVCPRCRWSTSREYLEAYGRCWHCREPMEVKK